MLFVCFLPFLLFYLFALLCSGLVRFSFVGDRAICFVVAMKYLFRSLPRSGPSVTPAGRLVAKYGFRGSHEPATEDP
uniref:Putative secreted peptide n=1 Tax=Anopheles braziliensis TaxID=58242 RepID=A0A2M3ZUB9_9DIPT